MCVNDIIAVLAKKKSTKIPSLSFEKYFSLVFNKMEEIINLLQNGKADLFHQMYYQYWLHRYVISSSGAVNDIYQPLSGPGCELPNFV